MSLTSGAVSFSQQATDADPADLDPQCKAFIDALAAQKGPGWEELGAVESRKIFDSLTTLFGAGPEDVAAENVKLAERIPARIYRPKSVKQFPLPVVVYFHGGGWVVGNLETHDALCRRLASFAQCAVISVDYRLAPEHPFPASFDDSYDATVHIAANAEKYGLDAKRLIVAGDSAGGNLAAAVAIKARNEKKPKILAQVLIYPVIDDGCNTPSYNAFASDFGLKKVDMQWFWKQYMGGKETGVYAAPSKADGLESLPPAYIVTAQFDVLRDEAEQFAARMKNDGTSVELHRYKGMIHGFIHFAGAMEKGVDATKDIAQFVRQKVAQ